MGNLISNMTDEERREYEPRSFASPKTDFSGDALRARIAYLEAERDSAIARTEKAEQLVASLPGDVVRLSAKLFDEYKSRGFTSPHHAVDVCEAFALDLDGVIFRKDDAAAIADRWAPRQELVQALRERDEALVEVANLIATQDGMQSMLTQVARERDTEKKWAIELAKALAKAESDLNAARRERDEVMALNDALRNIAATSTKRLLRAEQAETALAAALVVIEEARTYEDEYGHGTLRRAIFAFDNCHKAPK